MSAAKRIIYFSEGSEKDQITFLFEKGNLFIFLIVKRTGAKEICFIYIYNVSKDEMTSVYQMY